MELTFHTRLAIWYAVVLGCLLALTAIGLSYALQRIAQRKFDAALWMVGAAETENIAARIRERGLERPDDSTVVDMEYHKLPGYEEGRLEKYVTLIDDLRHVADTSSNLSSPLPIDDRLLARSFQGEVVYETVEVNGIGSLRAIYMPVVPPVVEHPVVVMVGLPESFVRSEITRFQVLFGLAFFTLLLLTAASAVLLADRAIKPIEQITAAAESITARNLQARLPEPRRRDQIGRLIAVFNRMLERLGAAFEAHRRFTACAGLSILRD